MDPPPPPLTANVITEWPLCRREVSCAHQAESDVIRHIKLDKHKKIQKKLNKKPTCSYKNRPNRRTGKNKLIHIYTEDGT